MSLPNEIVSRVRAALPPVTGPVALHEPEIGGNAWRYVKDCLDTGWVSSLGAYVDRFEQDLSSFTGSSHVIACVNGTAALQLALVAAGVEPGDEVLLPALTFVGTANAVMHAGAVPHFVDVEPVAFAIDPARLDEHLDRVATPRNGVPVNKETGRRITAVVPVHVFGLPADLSGIAAACGRHGLTLVEDAAEALGSTHSGRHCGTFGRLGVLSFNGNKVVTTGGGGAVLCEEADLASRVRHLATTARKPDPWGFTHDMVAFNFRMPNLNAALGCAQLEQLPDLLARKRRLAESYAAAFTGLEGAKLIREPEWGRSNFWLNTLILDEDNPDLRDSVLRALHAAGLLSRPVWTPMHHLPMYSGSPRAELPVTESVAARAVSLPSSARLARTPA